MPKSRLDVRWPALASAPNAIRIPGMILAHGVILALVFIMMRQIQAFIYFQF